MYTFLYVPEHPSRNSRERCHKVIRSYTSGVRSNDVPAGNLKTCVQKLYVPIRPEYVPMTFLQVIFKYVSESYTFLYVPSQLYSKTIQFAL
jgi:hypothetical protein